MSITSLCHKENKEVLVALEAGMKDNQEVMTENIQMLKQKIGIKQ